MKLISIYIKTLFFVTTVLFISTLFTNCSSISKDFKDAFSKPPPLPDPSPWREWSELKGTPSFSISNIEYKPITNHKAKISGIVSNCSYTIEKYYYRTIWKYRTRNGSYIGGTKPYSETEYSDNITENIKFVPSDIFIQNKIGSDVYCKINPNGYFSGYLNSTLRHVLTGDVKFSFKELSATNSDYYKYNLIFYIKTPIDTSRASTYSMEIKVWYYK